jgi:hypothetical protein
MPLDMLEQILARVGDAPSLCTARMVSREFRMAGALPSLLTSLTIPGIDLPLVDMERPSPQLRVAIRPLDLRQICMLSAPSLRPRIWSVALQLDLTEPAWQEELPEALRSLASLPGLQRLELKTVGSGFIWADELVRDASYDKVGQALASLTTSATLRELVTSHAFKFEPKNVLVLSRVQQLTSLTMNVNCGWNGGCGRLSRLSGLRALHMLSYHPPKAFVSMLSALEKLTWSPEWSHGLGWRTEESVRHFIQSLVNLSALDSLIISGQAGRHCPWPQAPRGVTQLTSLTYLDVGFFSSARVSSLGALQNLAHLKVVVNHKWVLRGSLEVPSPFDVIDRCFSSLSSLTGLTHLCLGMDAGLTCDDTISVGWDSVESGSFRSPNDGRLQFQSLTSLSLTGKSHIPDEISNMLRQVPLLTSFITDKRLTDANLAGLAGMSQLQTLKFALDPSAAEGDLLMLSALTTLTCLTCEPLSDKPKLCPPALSAEFVSVMNAFRLQRGWPAVVQLS